VEINIFLYKMTNW